MGVSSPAIIPLFSLWFQFISEKEKFPASPRPSFPSSPSCSFSFHHSLVLRCKKRKIIDRFQMEEQRRRRGAPAALTTSTAPNEMLGEWFFFPLSKWERGTTKCTVGLLLIFLPSLPPFPACLQHMSPPLVAMATAPHVADRRRNTRGRGGENKGRGEKRRVG